MMMRRLCHLAKIASLAMVILWFGHAAVRAEVATGWVGDIPVPVEALIETDSAVNFDSPSGRVIRFTFRLAMDETAVARYYNEALTGLGWQVSTTAYGVLYQRGTEAMRIAPITASSDPQAGLAYQVTLAPINSATFQ